MKKRLLLLLSFPILALAAAYAQGPNGTGKYYLPADGLTGKELKTALFQIIRDPGIVRYEDLQQAYIVTDTRSDGYLRDFYSNDTQFKPGSKMASGNYEGYNYNREHTVCQSWFGSLYPMYSDIVMVIPTDAWVNSRRNNNPFGEVTDNEANYKTSANGYSKWGAPRADLGCPAGVTTVFEPNDDVKGDIARIYFYMATCYEDRATGFTGGTGAHVFNADGTSYEPLQPWVLEMMMRWSAMDPVDDVERARNNAVQQVQKNRNPFVDYPGLEAYIWGGKAETPFSYDDFEGQGPGEEIDNAIDCTPIESGATISFTNEFFGVDWTGARPTGSHIQLSGREGNVAVVYYRGQSGSNMFCNATQIRLYQKNTLTMRIDNGLFSELEFTLAEPTAKTLAASTGTVTDYTWTGNASEVVFSVDDGSGNAGLKGVTVYTVATGIWALPEVETSDEVDAIYDLNGRRRDTLQPGLNIVRMKDGRVIKMIK